MKGRKNRATGGVNESEKDMSTKNQKYTYESKVNDEAQERKRGGKTVGKVDGKDAKERADRKPRKSGGRAGSDQNPFTSARKGTPPPGHKVEMNMD